VSYYDSKYIDKVYYFQIHYNFNSDAFLITAMNKIQIEIIILKKNKFMLIMTNTSIHCEGVFKFIAEFSDLSNCIKEHEWNYQEYTTKLSILNASYMITSLDENSSIDHECKNKAILSKRAFKEVHKAMNNKNENLFIIKILNEEKESKIKEVNVMSKLCHVSLFMLFYAAYADHWKREYY